MLRALILSILLCHAGAPARADGTIIFAASSLKSALDEVLEGAQARVSYGGSGALARQIQQGAPAEIFISANPEWMDVLALEGAATLLTNTLVIVSRDHAALLPEGRVAMGLLASVPAGIYGKAYLQAEGLWPQIAPRVIETDSARAALALAAKGEAAYAVVYATDAAAEPRVQIAARLDARPELPILYPMALTAKAKPPARALFARIQSPQARNIFARHGFGAP